MNILVQSQLVTAVENQTECDFFVCFIGMIPHTVGSLGEFLAPPDGQAAPGY